jgi:hypothetical protein
MIERPRACETDDRRRSTRGTHDPPRVRCRLVASTGASSNGVVERRRRTASSNGVIGGVIGGVDGRRAWCRKRGTIADRERLHR